MHRRVSLSAISTYSWDLDADLRFYADAGITNVGISVAKLERFGWDDGTRRVVDAGLRVTNLIGLGPFHLAHPDRWDAQRERIVRALDTATAVGAECLVFTTGPAGPLPWDEAADALEAALAPVLPEAASRAVPFAIEHTNSLRVDIGFVHTLADAIDLAGRLAVGVCMEVNLSTPNRLVPGDGDIPLERIVGDVLSAGYAGCFDLELVGPRIDEEGYEPACRRSVDRLTAMLTALGA